MAETPATAMQHSAGFRMALASAAGLGWVLGAAAQLQMVSLLSAAFALAVATAGAALGLTLLGLLHDRAGRGRPTGLRAVVAAVAALVAAALLGWASTHHRAAQRLADALPAALEGQDLQLLGTVAGLPREGLQGVRFEFVVEAAWHRGQVVRVPQRVSLGWWRGIEADALLAGPSQPVRAGQRWRFTARLARPHGALNPHGFDLELWLFEQGVRATGSVRDVRGTPAPALLDVAAAHPVQRMRQAVRDAIEARVPDAGAAGVLAALAVGDQAAIELGNYKIVGNWLHL